MNKKIKRLLIANRGEIALRVVKTCRELGIETITLHTEEERELPHSYAGDVCVCLGEGALHDTYLNMDKIIEIAKSHNADAIHPGYGFLSENSQFVKLVKKAGIIFVGPAPESMEIMGDKIRSKIEMEKVGAPLIPGYHGDNQESEFLKKEAEKIGYPVLIKASAGGGGKGMRVVESSEDFITGLDAAKREAIKAFGDDKVLIEKYITEPRHIEVQVLSDSHGNHLHLFERECSIQRRHQKIIEETPSTALSPQLRNQITEAAVNISRGIDYLGAGTVEFILDKDGDFYFLEMNTRLQVEHPITEMVTGVDLVKCQIQVAEGEKLPFTQQELVQKGHAIELRLYAEDPDNHFLPSIGRINHVGFPHLSHTRLDSGYAGGNDVSISFDPMLAKLIVWGETREEAIHKSILSLREVPFLGITTNREYLERILNHSSFVEGETYTNFVDTHKEDLAPSEISNELMALGIAAYFLKGKKTTVPTTGNGQIILNGPWESLSGFRIS